MAGTHGYVCSHVELMMWDWAVTMYQIPCTSLVKDTVSADAIITIISLSDLAAADCNLLIQFRNYIPAILHKPAVCYCWLVYLFCIVSTTVRPKLPHLPGMPPHVCCADTGVATCLACWAQTCLARCSAYHKILCWLMVFSLCVWWLQMQAAAASHCTGSSLNRTMAALSQVIC